MAEFDFPTAPADEQIYFANGRIFEYNSSKERWESLTTTGSQGIQGVQGIQGLLGNQGIQGRDGSNAGQGIQGIQGAQGSQGNQGFQGVAGEFAGQGIQGIQGTQGIAGEFAAQGIQGIQGTGGAGEQGIQGIQGAQGSQGNQGIQGTGGAGEQGIQGTQGSQGTQGPQGIQGNIGVNTVPSAGNDKTSSYTLQIDDVGDFVSLGSGGSIVIPSNTFSAGDVITIYNNTTGNRTITSSAVTSYITGADVNLSSLTLATRGLATILFTANNNCVISGAVF